MKNWLIRKLGAIPKQDAIDILFSLSGPHIESIKEHNDVLYFSVHREQIVDYRELSIIYDTSYAAAEKRIKDF